MGLKPTNTVPLHKMPKLSETCGCICKIGRIWQLNLQSWNVVCQGFNTVLAMQVPLCDGALSITLITLRQQRWAGKVIGVRAENLRTYCQECSFRHWLPIRFLVLQCYLKGRRVTVFSPHLDSRSEKWKFDEDSLRVIYGVGWLYEFF